MKIYKDWEEAKDAEREVKIAYQVFKRKEDEHLRSYTRFLESWFMKINGVYKKVVDENEQLKVQLISNRAG